MNQKEKDILLSLLVAKYLDDKQIISTDDNSSSSPRRTRSNLDRHQWTTQDLAKVTYLYKQGYTLSYIADAMGLRRKQVHSCIYNKLQLQRTVTVQS